jgi:DNA-binding XRE family transcriptional regulator
VSTTAKLSTVPESDEAEAIRLASPTGTVADTVLPAARLSAQLTQAQLAEAISAHEASIAGWEDGTYPLTTVAYPVLERLEAELTAAQAGPDLVSDLTIAIWCDLVITAVAASEDISCLMADPTAAEEAFSELLAWSASDQRPERYLLYALPGPLLRPADLELTAGTIRKLGRAARFLGQSAA